MIQRILFVSFLFIASLSISQEAVTWTYTFDKKENIILLHAEIDKGWHLYSQHVDEGVGPIPTAFLFEKTKTIKFLGKVKEPEPISEYDENFEGNVTYFENEVTFKQKIKIKETGDVDVTITYMVCNGDRCLPPADKIITLRIEK